MKKKIIYLCIFLLFGGWLIKDDLPFLWMYLHKQDMTQIQGVITGKYSKSVHLIRGGNKLHYFINIQDMNSRCSGTSRISKDKFNTLNHGDKILLLRYKDHCLAAFDLHMYTPPLLQFVRTGALLLIAFIYLGGILWQFLQSGNQSKPGGLTPKEKSLD